MRASHLLLGLFATAAVAAQAQVAPPAELARTEQAYADFNDATGAIGLIDSGYTARHGGRDRDSWARELDQRRNEVRAGVDQLRARELTALDRRAMELMAAAVTPTDSSAGLATVARCADAGQAALAYTALSESLYACFDELGNNLDFEGQRLTRVGAFDLLARIPEPGRRKELFHAFVPLWRAINGDGGAESPYRRLIAMAAAEARVNGSAIDEAARTLGISTHMVEEWLVRILDAWRIASGGPAVEPWDYRHAGGAAERELGDLVPLDQLQVLSARYYADLGANLAAMNVIYDLTPRPGKAPLAYADFVSRGRLVEGTWQPTVARVSANYARGGFGVLNELVHEEGHVVHIMAMRTRPAFMDWGDSLFVEAFADVPSWSMYDPAWQKRYLGRSSSTATSLRSLYSSVMLDVAWALFEHRMLREPASDPNLVWTEITSRYLNVVPHPELAWWAVRVQLVGSPGYMVNYGLGAVLTADLRERVRTELGPFATGDPRWYGWVGERLLQAGAEQDTATLLRGFLGRAVTPDALIGDIRRIEQAP